MKKYYEPKELERYWNPPGFLCDLKHPLIPNEKIDIRMKNAMKTSKQKKAVTRKKLIANYSASIDKQKKDRELFENLVIKKNEYYDQLTTEDALLSTVEKLDLPDSK